MVAWWNALAVSELGGAIKSRSLNRSGRCCSVAKIGSSFISAGSKISTDAARTGDEKLMSPLIATVGIDQKEREITGDVGEEWQISMKTEEQ